MRLCRSWLAFGLVSVLSAPLPLQAAVVYKWTDADGVVHFSDQPVPGAEKIVTDGSSSRGIMNAPMPAALRGEAQGRIASRLRSHIHRLARRPNQTFSGSRERCDASATVEPELQPGGPISISLELERRAGRRGRRIHAFQARCRTSPGVSTLLSATLTDAASGATKSADPVTFNVLRPSCPCRRSTGNRRLRFTAGVRSSLAAELANRRRRTSRAPSSSTRS